MRNVIMGEGKITWVGRGHLSRAWSAVASLATTLVFGAIGCTSPAVNNLQFLHGDSLLDGKVTSTAITAHSP